MDTVQAEVRSLTRERYLNLETFRKNGAGVRPPIWFAVDAKFVFYVYTTADSGKAKRVRRNGAVRIAACDMRGGVTGPWLGAKAALVTGKAYEQGMMLLNRKYRPWNQILGFFAWAFRRRDRVVIAIRPV